MSEQESTEWTMVSLTAAIKDETDKLAQRGLEGWELEKAKADSAVRLVNLLRQAVEKAVHGNDSVIRLVALLMQIERADEAFRVCRYLQKFGPHDGERGIEDNKHCENLATWGN